MNGRIFLTLAICIGLGASTSPANESAQQTALPPALRINLLVDSTNDNILDEKDDAIEDDASKPGTVFSINNEDTDEDGIVDYADGFNHDARSGTADEQKDDRITSERVTFAPLKILLPAECDPQKTRIRFQYPASAPKDLQVTIHEKYKEFKPPATPIRLWTKGASLERNGKSCGEGGNFLSPGDAVLLSALEGSGRERVVYIEGVEPGPARIVAEVAPAEDTPAWVQADAVRITAIVMEFVMPEASYHEKENYDAMPVPVNFVGVSDPRSTIRLAQPTTQDVVIDNAAHEVRVTVRCDEVRDPIADNIPFGAGADIESVTLTLDGEAGKTTYPVKRVGYRKAGPKGFWRQFPYKGVFDPIVVTIPLETGEHVICVTTSKNVAGNTAQANLIVTISQEEKVWKASAKRGYSSDKGFYAPITQRIRGFASAEVIKDFKLEIQGIEMPLEEHDGAFYASTGLDDEEEWRKHGD